MTSYAGYASSVETTVTAAESLLDPVINRGFKDARGHLIEESLPDKQSEWTYDRTRFGADVDPERRTIENRTYDGKPLTTERVAAAPEQFVGLGETLDELWSATFDRSPRWHRGGKPTEGSAIDAALEQLRETWATITAQPTLDHFVEAIKSGHPLTSARILDIDPETLWDPTSSHELGRLFRHGDVHVVFRDMNYALVKPEVNHAVILQVINDQSSSFGRIRFDGAPPEPAYVVGRDDTPRGLFAHMVDGTHLDADSEVTIGMIRDVMGFDRDYASLSADGTVANTDEIVGLERDIRTRLQGDLACQRVRDDPQVTDADRLHPSRSPEENDGFDGEPAAPRLNLPIDNHLVVIDGGIAVNADTEPVAVHVPERVTMNVLHDEHEEVATTLERGIYRFYLLERGIQPAGDRPRW